MDTKKLYSLFTSSSGVSIDTRNLISDQIFFSLKGENFNGNHFALEALDKGACYSIIDDKSILDKNPNLIYVEDSLKALQKLSSYHRSQYDTKIIGVTGSNGKTTTKNLIYSILSQKYNVIKTKGNLNNHIGVPISLFDINEDVDIAIIEMGANHIGEIESLCEIAMPDIGLITNYGKAHLEGFGGFEGVIKGKTEMFDYLTQNYGHIILNNDDKLQIENCKGDLAVTFGENQDSEYTFNYIKRDNQLILKSEDYEFRSSIYGDYNFSNIASSISIGKFLDLTNDEIQKGLDIFKNDSNRSEIIQFGSNKIYLDAYNANPTSIKAAISNFDKEVISNKVLVLGDMFELGEHSEKEHQDVVDLIDNKNYKKVYLVGNIFFNCESKEEHIEKFKSLDEMSKAINLNDLHSMNILIKGSRGIGLEKLLNY